MFQAALSRAAGAAARWAIAIAGRWGYTSEDVAGAGAKALFLS